MNDRYVKQLLQCENLNTFLSMFFGFSQKEQNSIFTTDFTVAKGTKLFRIRKDDGKTDFSNQAAWQPPPEDKINQGRFNDKNEQVLYVSSSPDWLEREVALKQGEYYYLATYICKNSFKVGTLFNEDDFVCSILHSVARSIENSSCLTEKELSEFNKLQSFSTKPKDIILNQKAPFYIHKEIKNLYDYTNKIGKLVLRHNKNGIRYASAFDPIELMGGGVIFTLDGIERANFALTKEGITNIEFVSADRKQCNSEYSLDVFFKVMNEVGEENEQT